MSDLAWSEVGGSGDPFLLVHGYTGSRDDFAHVVPPLQELRRLFLVDLLGHGASPRRPAYSLDQLTDSLVGFVENVVGEPLDLLGHSMGGRISLPIATDHPGLVRSLVLMDTWADSPDRDHASIEFGQLVTLPDAAAIDALDAYEAPMSPEAALIEQRWGRSWVEAHAEFNDQVDRLAVVQLGRELYGDAPSLLGEAARVACPTTVIVGELDQPFRGPSDRLVAAVPGAHLEVIEGAYHSPQLTHPTEWQEAIAAHLRGSRRPQTG